MIQKGLNKIHPIKSVYNFIVSIQMLALVVFLFYLIENNLDLPVPLTIGFSIPVPGLDPIVVNYSYIFHFNLASILGMLLVMGLIYIISSINALGSGLTDSGSNTIKQIVNFLSKYLILNLPIIYLMSQSVILFNYSILVSIIIFVVYVLNFLTDTGDEK